MDRGRIGTSGWPTVVLTEVDGLTVALWSDARAIEPEAFACFDLVSETERSPDRWEVVVRVDPLAKWMAGVAGKREMAETVHGILDEIAQAVIEEDHLSEEIEALPVLGSDAVFSPHTLVVEWTIADAYLVMEAVRQSVRDAGCVELMRVGGVRSKTVLVAASLPKSLFDAAIMKYRAGSLLADGVRDAIFDAYGAEPRPRGDVSGDIPF